MLCKQSENLDPLFTVILMKQYHMFYLRILFNGLPNGTLWGDIFPCHIVKLQPKQRFSPSAMMTSFKYTILSRETRIFAQNENIYKKQKQGRYMLVYKKIKHNYLLII